MLELFNSKFDGNLTEVPYKDNQEYLSDILKLYEMKILNLFKLEHEGSSPEQLTQLKGLVISKSDIVNILSGDLNVVNSQVESSYKEDIEYAENFIENRARHSIKKGIFLPLHYISTVFKLNHFERHCVMLGLTVELNRKFEKLYGFLQDDITLRLPTLELAIKLYTLESGIVPVILSMLNERKIMERYFFLSLYDAANDRSDLSRVLKLNGRILNFIMDTGIEDDNISRMIKVFYPNHELDGIIFGRELVEQMEELLKGDEIDSKPFLRRRLLYLRGSRGAGKKFLVRHVCKSLNRTVLMVDTEKMLKPDNSFESNIDAVCAEAILQGAVLCFHKFEVLDEEKPDDVMKINMLLKCIERMDNAAFILSEKDLRHKRDISGYDFVDIEVPVPDSVCRFEIWKEMMTGYTMREDIDLSGLANKFQFTPGLIQAALKAASDMSLWLKEPAISEKTLYSACLKQVSHKLSTLANIIKPVFKWKDIILPEESKKLLKNACDVVKYKHIVHYQWGFDKKMPYGKGLSVLLYGPPGTGKTMAAQVMANELQLEIYKINLAESVSKYIGETEKNLQQIFGEAKKSSTILFFDEADSIFGKRTEVKDSHDRYANMEVSFLLQKIEEHEGITILATNFAQNFDDAFKRRINFIVEFPFPNASYRKEIWKSVYPEEAPVDTNVDFDFLAERFELSGSNIKNIAVSSAYLAAGDGTAIDMKHILTALKYEYFKIGKTLLKEDIGPYVKLLNQ